MSDADQTKRERQKARREAKVAQEQQVAAKSRRSRFALLGLAVLLVIAAVTWVVVDRQQQAAADEELIAQAEEEAGNVGCTPIEEQPDLGAGHIATDPAALAANDPATLYPDRPATSGQHYPSWIISGFYEEQIDERLLVHNLEHGYVNFYYGPDAPTEGVAELREFTQQEIENDGGRRKVIAAPWPDPLPNEANFVIAAWNQRQLCEQFDPQVADAFATQYISGEAAPERFLDAHLTSDQGIDPAAEDGPLLFPPLAGEQPPADAPEMAPGESDVQTSGSDAASPSRGVALVGAQSRRGPRPPVPPRDVSSYGLTP